MINMISNRIKRIGSKALTVVASMFVLAIPGVAMATGTTGDELASAYTQIVNLTQGSLGRLITLLFIVVGIVGGIARQSLIAFAVGLGGGIGLYNAPTIITAVFGASV